MFKCKKMSSSYPYPGYNFTLDILPFNFGQYDCSFQEISGLNATVNVDTVKEGGSNTYEYHLPTGTSWTTIVLKRGVIGGTPLLNWINAGVGFFTFLPLPGMINLKDNSGKIVISWMFMDLYPVKFETSSLNAMNNGLLFETFELHHSGYTRIDY